MKNSLQHGFTMVELLIVAVVVAILAAVAYPSYTQHIRKAQRADAQAVLMNAAARQQQYLLDTRAYAATLTALNVPVPDAVSARYTVSMVVGTATVPSFSVIATPRGTQAADKCGTLSLDQAGVKTPSTCW